MCFAPHVLLCYHAHPVDHATFAVRIRFPLPVVSVPICHVRFSDVYNTMHGDVPPSTCAEIIDETQTLIDDVLCPANSARARAHTLTRIRLSAECDHRFRRHSLSRLLFARVHPVVLAARERRVRRRFKCVRLTITVRFLSLAVVYSTHTVRWSYDLYTTSRSNANAFLMKNNALKIVVQSVKIAADPCLSLGLSVKP